MTAEATKSVPPRRSRAKKEDTPVTDQTMTVEAAAEAAAEAPAVERAKSPHDIVPLRVPLSTEPLSFRVLRAGFYEHLKTLSRAAAAKSTLPILANVLLQADADEGELTMAATNLEVGLQIQMKAHVTVSGSITVPIKRLTDLVSLMPHEFILITLDPKITTVTVTGITDEKTKLRNTGHIPGIDAEEFPTIPAISDAKIRFSAPGKVLNQLITKVAFASADNDSRPSLAGMLIRISKGQLQAAAADGFRLSAFRYDLPGAEDFEAIIPRRSMAELGRLVEDDKQIDFSVTEGGSQIRMSNGIDTILVSRLIDGKFPDFDRIIPTSYSTRVIVDREELLRMTRLGKLFASSSQNVLKLSLREGELEISANSAEVGSNVAQIEAMTAFTHDPFFVTAANCDYLVEALSVMETKQIAIELQSAQSAIVLKEVGGTDIFSHIIMPMQVR